MNEHLPMPNYADWVPFSAEEHSSSPPPWFGRRSLVPGYNSAMAVTAMAQSGVELLSSAVG